MELRLLPAFHWQCGVNRMTEIRVLIADDHAVLRSGLKLLVSTQNDMVVVGEAGDFLSARDKIQELRPNVVTLDLSMPGGDAVSDGRWPRVTGGSPRRGDGGAEPCAALAAGRGAKETVT